MKNSSIQEISVFLIHFQSELKELIDQLNYKKNGPLSPWMAYDDFKFESNLTRKDDVLKLSEKLNIFESIILILPDFKSNFKPLLSEIKTTANDFKAFYDNYAENELIEEFKNRRIQENNDADRQIAIYNEKHVLQKDESLRAIDETEMKIFIKNTSFILLQNVCVSIFNIISQQSENTNELTGFSFCDFDELTKEKIHQFIVDNEFIKPDLKNFKAIFNNTPTSINKPVEWIKRQGDTFNNRAFHAFLRIMLNGGKGELSRDNLKIANKVFTFQGKQMYPGDELKYPSNDSSGNDWFDSSRRIHYIELTKIIKKQDQI